MIFVRPSMLRLMATIMTEPQQVSSAMAASDRTGARTCASRTLAPWKTRTNPAEHRTPMPSVTGERAVEIQKRARGGAEDHGDDQHQRIFALKHTADAGIERAEGDGGHDRAGDLFRDAFPGQKTDGAAEQDGQRIDENSEHAKRSFLKVPVKIATIVPHRAEKRKIFFEK